MTTVVVVGSVNVDLVVTTPEIPAPGQTVLGSDLVYRPGGKGGNQAVAAHRLGADTVLIAAIGDDRLGEDLRSALVAEGLDVSRIAITENVATGVALIAVDQNGENSIVVAPGANHRLGGGAVLGMADVIDDADVLVLQMETPVQTSLEAAKLASGAGVKVILNAAPLRGLADPAFENLLGLVDVLVVNEGEAVRLTDIEPPSSPDGWAQLANLICRSGPDVCVITLGEQGAVAGDGSQSFVQQSFDVDVVDSTGAGDAFAGTLAVAIADGKPMADALRAACAAGAFATTRLGAQEAMASAEELQRLLAGDGSK